MPTVMKPRSDALSGLAPLLRVRPEIQYVCRFGEQWASSHGPEPAAWAPFHIVTRGTCVLHLPESRRSITLNPGDVAILPRGSAHVVHAPATLPDDDGPFGIESASDGAVVLKFNTVDPAVELICGRLVFAEASRTFVVAAFPEVIIMTDHSGDDVPRLRDLIILIRDELDVARPGAAAIATDLASALLVMVVRAHVEFDRATDTVLALLRHPQVGRAVAAMIKDPVHAWTLDTLAVMANASRASLVRAFREAAQVSPMRFLAGLRLESAKLRLSESDHTLADIAAAVGYSSESAFSRAFRSRFGVRPGGARNRPAPSGRPAG